MRIIALAAVLLLSATAAGAEEPLPRPASLEPAVRFWTRVYTEVDVSGGLTHDAAHLDVVYEVIQVPRGFSSRAREQRIEAAKSRIRAALRTLASGKRSGAHPRASARQADRLHHAAHVGVGLGHQLGGLVRPPHTMPKPRASRAPVWRYSRISSLKHSTRQ